MIPVLTGAQMRQVDAQATEPLQVLIDRSGAAVARSAQRLLGGTYGRRVTVVVGKGNNGADGLAAARRLAQLGVAVSVLEAGELGAGQRLPFADLFIDAAYGTGSARGYQAPDTGDAQVLAVDIVSGLDSTTGRPSTGRPSTGQPSTGQPGGDQSTRSGQPVKAAATVTFAALKPGLLLASGRLCSGDVEVADIGLGAGVDAICDAWLIEDTDVAGLLPRRPTETHKWQSAVQVVAGSPGMTGAPWMASRAAFRAGAGYVKLGLPGIDPSAAGLPPGELVITGLPDDDWDAPVLASVGRTKALVVGPGLGRSDETAASLKRLVAKAPVPTVIDADGLYALGSVDELARLTASRDHPLVVTPHDGEFAKLFGHPPTVDRLACVRAAAADSGAVVLLKGSTTIVAAPDGRAMFVTSGSPRLATAGTGDVLSGVIGAFLARGMAPLEAAAIGAHVHGRAASGGFAEGLVASDLPDLVAQWLSRHLAGDAAADWLRRPAWLSEG